MPRSVERDEQRRQFANRDRSDGTGENFQAEHDRNLGEEEVI